MQKICKTCNIEKSLINFYSQNKIKANGDSYIYYNSECKDCAKYRADKWAKDNPEKRRELKSNYNKKSDRREAKKKQSKEQREDGYFKNWQDNNKEKIKQYNQNRNMNKKHNISKEEWRRCKEYFNNECAYCGLLEENHYKSYQGKLKKMDLHKEHVEHNGENDLSNCVPSCHLCNSSKRDISLSEWYVDKNMNYKAHRLLKIQNWINGDYKTQ